jgi:DNA (cytosine-5)-methyltransferase 1
LLGDKALLTKKLGRLARGDQPRVLDLFAGCGGLSLGFQSENFKLVGAVEFDPVAVRTHARNFFKGPDRVVHSEPTDITKTSPDDFLANLGVRGDARDQVDVVIGGPPCQAFARVGRAKLREIGAHPKAFLHDPRARLFNDFLSYVKRLRPVVVLMENVPDALNYGGYNVLEEVGKALEEIGYSARYTLLNAAYYGVPQMRERAFLLAYSKALLTAPEFPEPTHWVELPRGYRGTRQVAFKGLKLDLFNPTNLFVDAPASSPHLTPAVSAREALQDLPPITAHLNGMLSRGVRRFTTPIPYPKIRLSAFAELIRNWPGFEANGGVSDHVIRWLPRDYAVFRRMNPGDQYPQAYAHALELFQEKLSVIGGPKPKVGSPLYRKLRTETVPPYDPTKFPNRWRKMEADLPARTLMAHIGKDSYTHIHYDSEQARTISVREAARLQSFPDGFVFEGSMNHAFRQIGNAVPPLLSRAIAKKIREQLKVLT